MDEIAALAGLTKPTLYNNYADKDALFVQIVADVLAYAETFARGLRQEFAGRITAANLEQALVHLGCRLVTGIVRPEVIALRRLLIGEARHFHTLGRDYFERAPGQVLSALAAEFARLNRAGLLRLEDARQAAAQFAYLAVGEALDRAMLVGKLPPEAQVVAREKAFTRSSPAIGRARWPAAEASVTKVAGAAAGRRTGTPRRTGDALIGAGCRTRVGPCRSSRRLGASSA